MPESISYIDLLKRTLRLLDYTERRRSIALLAIILANSFVEILGLAVVVPVIRIVVQPETIEANDYLHRAFNLAQEVGIDSHQGFLVLMCVLMIAAFLFKAIFGLAVNFSQSRFSFAVAHRLSGQMWTYHFSQSLERMRTSNSGRILAEINSWPVQVANAFLIKGLMVVSETTIILIVALGLLAYNPTIFLCIVCLLVLGSFAIRTATKKRLTAYGKIRQRLEPLSNTLITNAIRGFLEVITFRATEAVKSSFMRTRWEIFKVSSNASVLQKMPSKLYEFLAVFVVGSSIIVALIGGTPQNDFLELLTLLAISAYRVMPSMSRINGAIMQMNGQNYLLDIMELGQRHVATMQSNPTNRATSLKDIAIKINDLTLSYQESDTPVVEHLNKQFDAGKVHAIVGPSGCGKSTIIGALLGLHEPDSGHICVQCDGETSVILGEDMNLSEWLFNVGFLSQNPFLFEGTVKDNLTLRVPNATIDEERVHRLIKALKLDECLGDNPLEFELQEGGANLSGGQQQRLALLRALQTDRTVLILDEATSALDSMLRNVVFELLQARAKEGCNIVLVTHDASLAAMCDDVLDLGKPQDQ